MTRLKQRARILDAAVRDLRLHKLARPVDVTDAAKFPNNAEACDYRAAMSPERRAELDGEWQQ
jgi:hypothetical protein